MAQLPFLDNEDPERDISLYINSPGGSVIAGLAIYAAMRMIRADVRPSGMGLSASIGTILLAGGAKGKRFSLPHSKIDMHPVVIRQLSGNAPISRFTPANCCRAAAHPRAIGR